MSNPPSVTVTEIDHSSISIHPDNSIKIPNSGLFGEHVDYRALGRNLGKASWIKLAMSADIERRNIELMFDLPPYHRKLSHVLITSSIDAMLWKPGDAGSYEHRRRHMELPSYGVVLSSNTGPREPVFRGGLTNLLKIMGGDV